MRTSGGIVVLAPLVLSCAVSSFAQEELGRKLNSRIIMLCQQGRYSEAVNVAEEALKVAENTFDSNDSRVALSLNNLALLYASQGRSTEAESCLKRAQKMWEQVLGPDHTTMALSQNDPAALRQSESEYADDEALFGQALPIDEKILEKVHLDAQDINEKMALLCKKMEGRIGSVDRGKEPTIVARVKEERTETREVEVIAAVKVEPESKIKKVDLPRVALEEPKVKAAHEGKGRYTVNIGSFKERVTAERVMNEFNEKRYKAFITKAAIPRRGTWYRVSVGRFASLKEAQAFARALKKKEKADCFVRKLKEVKRESHH